MFVIVVAVVFVDLFCLNAVVCLPFFCFNKTASRASNNCSPRQEFFLARYSLFLSMSWLFKTFTVASQPCGAWSMLKLDLEYLASALSGRFKGGDN